MRHYIFKARIEHDPLGQKRAVADLSKSINKLPSKRGSLHKCLHSFRKSVMKVSIHDLELGNDKFHNYRRFHSRESMQAWHLFKQHLKVEGCICLEVEELLFKAGHARSKVCLSMCLSMKIGKLLNEHINYLVRRKGYAQHRCTVWWEQLIVTDGPAKNTIISLFEIRSYQLEIQFQFADLVNWVLG